MKVIENRAFSNERDLYAEKNLRLVNCRFDGVEDGESALKEAKNVELHGCYMNLRYPLWHDAGVMLSDVTMTENCRAALWYTRNVAADNCRFLGIKALRECKNITIRGSKIASPEFGWRSRNVTVSDSEIVSEYLFLSAKDVQLSNVRFNGKYSFQYTQNVTIENSVLDTKDAFWHAKNVVIKNCVVNGEYLGWYSQNLTFVNCTITGTQPLCYCSNLKLVDCQMQNTDLSFEYSDVQATVAGLIDSVKNPRSGSITADGIGQIIITPDSKYPCACVIKTNL